MVGWDDNLPADDELLAQQFGGPWSLIKTQVVEDYIRFFNIALQNKPSPNDPFERIYVDAFAGSGAFTFTPDNPETNTLFGPTVPEVHAGSAQRALEVRPPFDRLVFIDADRGNVEGLRKLTAKYPNATVINEDANAALATLCQDGGWTHRRGVIFLDPFATAVDWTTLQSIAGTRALDAWILFPLAATVRCLPRDAARQQDGMRKTVTRVLGTDEWFDRFYEADEPGLIPETLTVRRTADPNDIEAYVRERLQTIFPHVEAPLRLRSPRNTSLFSLFFAVSNPSKRAITPAVKVARHLLNAHGQPGTRPRSGRRSGGRSASY